MNILFTFKYANFISTSARRSMSYQIERLHRRALIKLSGIDVFNYLQGLTTNNIDYLTGDGKALFTHFLNHKGRTLYDTLLFKSSENEVLLECDASIQDEIVKHLTMYRVRKKVHIEPFDGNVWSIFDKKLLTSSTLDENLLCKNDSKFAQIKSALCSKDAFAFQDPRIPSLGIRIFASVTENLFKMLYECNIRTVESENYIALRYKLGVPEGVSEIPVGKCSPLEMNCDYLQGVSFNKGCYIGQELTARTHHTGVVRKRIMPLILSSVPDEEFVYDSIITTEDDKVVGKLRGVYKQYGIALLRISEALQNNSKLKLNGVLASTYKPYWWLSEEKENSTDSTS